MNDVPDLVEPISGWRSWLVSIIDGEPRLVSPVRGTVWTPGEPFVATCADGCGSEARPSHSPAALDCSCGVHAARERAEAEGHLAPPSRRSGVAAVGRVALWGDVVEGEFGWRAGRAYPTLIELITWRADDHIVGDLCWIGERLANDYAIAVLVPPVRVRTAAWT